MVMRASDAMGCGMGMGAGEDGRRDRTAGGDGEAGTAQKVSNDRMKGVDERPGMGSRMVSHRRSPAECNTL